MRTRSTCRACHTVLALCALLLMRVYLLLQARRLGIAQCSLLG